MNIRLTAQGLRAVFPPRAKLPQKTKFSPRLGILHEVVAGILWMSLDLPTDASRRELERFAEDIAARIMDGASQTAVETEIAHLQAAQFCRAAGPSIVSDAARRIITVVRAY